MEKMHSPVTKGILFLLEGIRREEEKKLSGKKKTGQTGPAAAEWVCSDQGSSVAEEEEV